MFNSRVSLSVIVFILCMVLLFILKPKLSFDKNGDIRKFGIINDNDTIYSVGVISIMIAIGVFYLFCLIDLIFN